MPRSSNAVIERSQRALDQWTQRELPHDDHDLANVVLVAAARHNAVVDEIEELLSVRLERRLSPTEESDYQLLADAERALYGLCSSALARLRRHRMASTLDSGGGPGDGEGGSD